MTKEEEKDKEDLTRALNLIDRVVKRISNLPEGDYEWNWLDGICLSLQTFIKDQRSGEKNEACL